MRFLEAIVRFIEKLLGPLPAGPEPRMFAPRSWPERVSSAIATETLPRIGAGQAAVDILVRHSAIETGNWKAWYFQGPQKDGLPPTYNLVNRRAGSGRGEWTGHVKIVGGDDIRIYDDESQSARDLAQLLNDPLYKWALQALRDGDGAAYFRELERAKFSARHGDYAAAAENWEREHA